MSRFRTEDKLLKVDTYTKCLSRTFVDIYTRIYARTCVVWNCDSRCKWLKWNTRSIAVGLTKRGNVGGGGKMGFSD